MTNEFEIRMARQSDVATIGELVFKLLHELYPELSDLYTREHIADTTKKLLNNSSNIWAFITSTINGNTVGILTLNECTAIYAGGNFGEITELYVDPEFRSSGVGAELIDTAAEFGRKRGWSSIEVGAPSVPKWQRTVEFYRKYGFIEIGPRLDLTL